MSTSTSHRDTTVPRVTAKGHLNTVGLSLSGALAPNFIVWLLTALFILHLVARGVDAPITINDEVVPRAYNAWILLAEGLALLGGIAVGAWLLREANRQRRKYRDLGASILELEELPIAPGGRLVGVLKTGVDTGQQPPEGFLVKVERVRYVPPVSDEGGGSRTVLWRDEKRMRSTSDGNTSCLAVPIAFDLPTPLSKYKPVGRESIYWRLTVCATLPEGAFQTQMKVPVEEYETPPEGRPMEAAPSADDHDAASYEMPAREQPLSDGVEVRRMASSLEMHFHPELRRSSAATSTLGALFGMGLTGVGLYWMFVSACAGLFLALFGLLFAVPWGKSAFKQWFYTYSIRVSGNEIVVHSGLPRRLTEKRLRVSDLQSIGVRTTDTTYGIALHRRDGDMFTVPASLSRKEEADRLTNELADAAGLPVAPVA